MKLNITIKAKPKDQSIKIRFKCPFCRRDNGLTIYNTTVPLFEDSCACGCGRQFLVSADLNAPRNVGGLPVTIRMLDM